MEHSQLTLFRKMCFSTGSLAQLMKMPKASVARTPQIIHYSLRCFIFHLLAFGTDPDDKTMWVVLSML